MAPRLSHAAGGTVRNFYETSFRQLSDIQQRQVGLLLGAAIGDAAARPLQGLSFDSACAAGGAVPSLAFKRPADVAALVTARASDPAYVGASSSPLLHAHSLSYLLFAETVRVMASAGGDFDLGHVQGRWVRAAGEAPRELFAEQHGRLLHTLLAVLPFPVVYPYASDSTLRAYSTPFLEFLTTTPGETAHARTPAAASVHDMCLSALGVALRYLHSNPDATRNAAFTAVPGTGAIFPDDVRGFCRTKPVVQDEDTADTATREEELARLAEDVEAVREALIIARASRSFTDGVNRAILLGGSAGCQRAALVGALLGARLGARQLPVDWLSATADYRVMATLAIEVAQQTWNPAHH